MATLTHRRALTCHHSCNSHLLWHHHQAMNVPCTACMGLLVGQLRGSTSLKLFLHLCNMYLHITLQIATWLCIQETSRLGQGIDYTEVFFSSAFPTLQANAVTVTDIRPWLFPSTSFPIHYSLSFNHSILYFLGYWEHRITYMWNKK